MAREARFPFASGNTLDLYVFKKGTSEVWYPTGADFEEWGTAGRDASDYRVSGLTEEGSGSQYYVANFPTAITSRAVFDLQVRLRAGASPADSDIVVGMLALDREGSGETVATATPTTAAAKTDLVNRALAILNGGRTAQASTFFESITSDQFADWTSVSETDYPDIRLAVMLYDPILRQVLEELQPEFACEHADLGQPRKINQAFGGWDYLFELPDDYLCLVRQMYEGDLEDEPGRAHGYRCEPRHFRGYSHVVKGSDDQAYYCSTDHTSADDTSDGQPADDDGNGNWTLYNTDGTLGAAWAEDVDYEYDSTGMMLATNVLTNADGDSAYIKYVAYTQNARSDQPQYYPESFKNAFATRLAAEMALDTHDYERRRRLLEEYELLAKPGHYRVENRHRSREKQKTAFERRLTG